MVKPPRMKTKTAIVLAVLIMMVASATLAFGIVGYRTGIACAEGKPIPHSEGEDASILPPEPSPYSATTVKDIMEQSLQSISLPEIDRVMSDPKVRGLLDWAPGSVKETVERVSRGEPVLDIRGLSRYLMGYFLAEVRSNLVLLGKLILFCLVMALVTPIGSAFGSDAVTKVAEGACFLALAVLVMGSFRIASGVAAEAVRNLNQAILALLPTMTTLLAGSGAPVSAGILQPTMVMTISGVAYVVSTYVLPALLLAASLDIVGAMSDTFRLNHVSGFIRQAAMLVLGIGLSVFLGVVAVSRAAGEVSDNMALRSAKFLSNSLIPVVGKMVSDATELVFSSSLLLKNAVGIAGMIAIVAIVVVPLLKILSLAAIYRLAGVLTQPIGSNRMSDCLHALASSIMTLWAAVLTVSIMAFLSVTALVGLARPF
ncbi:MAG TPA: stage III sporulation protein AE [Clostridia bacterium]|nr:stage III sporulation protein AE [Clostridia bacterium]